MRLVCPSCAAEYEVDGAAIPPEGRDVQCSNCGHTWLQFPEGHGAPDASESEHALSDGGASEDCEPSDPGPDEPEPPAEAQEPEAEFPQADAKESDAAEPETPEPADLDAEPPAPAAAPEQDADEQDADEQDAPGTGPDDATEAGAAPPSGTKPRPPLDPAVIAILREEAEREAQARREEQTRSVLETQPDLGLVVPRRPASAAAVAQPVEAASVAEPSPFAAPRGPDGGNRGRDRLPDIEHFDSDVAQRAAASVAGRQAPQGRAVDDTEPKSPSARAGYVLALLVFALLAAIHVLSDDLAAAVPAAQPALAMFSDAVDAARLQLDAAVRAAIDGVAGLVARLRA